MSIIKTKIRRIKKLLCDSNEIIIKYSENINKKNQGMLRVILITTIVIYISLFIVSFFVKSYSNLRVAYGLLSIILICLLFFTPKKTHYTVILYVLFGVLSAVATYSSAILYPNDTGVLMLSYLIIMPIIVLDKPIRILLIECVFALLYLMFVFSNKSHDLVGDELLNVILFTLTGSCLGLYLSKVRLQNVKLREESYLREITDVLTGIANRRSLFNYFIDCEQNKNKKPITAISIFDIDLFKVYNDTYGHLAGDKCLKRIGDAIKEYGNKYDIDFYRYGGEEFIALFHNTDSEKVFKSCWGINELIEDLAIEHIGTKRKVVTVSQGIYPIYIAAGDEVNDEEKNDTKHFEVAISKADIALYNAKNNGRNRTVLYDKAMQKK